jgi:transcriptional regulator with XRE-family HTH domain
VTALAEASGVKRATLHSWFNGSAQPDLASLDLVAAALGVSRFEIVAAMDGAGPVVPLDAAAREAIREEIDRVLDERGIPPTPRAQGVSG